jgi:hypothetical protein
MRVQGYRKDATFAAKFARHASFVKIFLHELIGMDQFTLDSPHIKTTCLPGSSEKRERERLRNWAWGVVPIRIEYVPIVV